MKIELKKSLVVSLLIIISLLLVGAVVQAQEASCTCDGYAVGSTYRCDWVANNVLAPRENGAYTCQCTEDCRSEITSDAQETPQETTTTTQERWCKDPDGSNIYVNTRSDAIFDYVDGPPREGYSYDSCAATSGGASTQEGPYVHESECRGDYSYGAYYKCPTGFYCKQGACVGTSAVPPQPIPQTCSDSDGKDLYTKGITKGYNADKTKIITVKDSCTNKEGGAETYSGIWVVENVCDEKQRAHAYYYLCPTGKCSDGRCVGDVGWKVETPLPPVSLPTPATCSKDGVYRLFKDQEKPVGSKTVRANNVNKLGRTDQVGATLAVIEGENYDYSSFFRCEKKVVGGLVIVVKDYYFDGTDLGKDSYVVFDVVGAGVVPVEATVPTADEYEAPQCALTSFKVPNTKDNVCGDDLYRKAYWECSDGSSGVEGGSTSCKTPDQFKKFAAESCANKCGGKVYHEDEAYGVAPEEQKKEFWSQLGGCKYPGLRYIDLKTKQPVFCDENLAVQPQKEEGVGCQNNFECVSNYCGKGNVCVGIQQQLEETKGLIKKLMDWFKKFF